MTLMLLCGVSSVWAKTVTSTFTDKNWTVEINEPTWTAVGAIATSLESANLSRGVQITLSNIKDSGLKLSNTSIKNLGAISKVEIVYSSNCAGDTDGTIAVAVGTTNFGSAYTIAKENNATISFENATAVEGDIVITFTSTASSKSVYVKSITVTYEVSTAYTVTFDAGTYGTCTETSLKEESAGIGVTLPSCTANTGYVFKGWATTNSATEADAGVANETYYPIKDITLYAVYKKICTVNYKVNGVNTNPQEDVEEGTALVFPSVGNIGGKVFVGWSESEVAETNVKPTLVATTGLTVSASATYYAVFAKETAGGTAPVTKDIIAEAGLTSSVTLNADKNPYQMGELSITLTGIKGTNNYPAINYNSKSGTDLRFYSGTTCGVTFATTNGQPITKIEFKKNAETASTLGSSFSANVGTLSDNIWTGSANSVTITYSANANFKDQMYIVNVTYSETIPSIYTAYSTDVSYTREVTSGNFGTICLPYGGTVEGATLYSIAGKEMDGEAVKNIVLEEEGEELIGGIPYIFKATASKLKVSYTSDEYTDADNYQGLYGTYDAIKTLPKDGTVYVISQNQFWCVNSDVSCGANRAYIVLSEVKEASAANNLIIGNGNLADGINAVVVAPADSKMYNLNGQAVGADYKGVVIMNGKKMFNK